MLIIVVLLSIVFVALFTVTAEELMAAVKWRNKDRISLLITSLIVEIIGIGSLFSKLETYHRNVCGSIVLILLVVVSTVYVYKHFHK